MGQPFFVVPLLKESIIKQMNDSLNNKKKSGKLTSNLSKYVRFSGMGLQMGLTIWIASLFGKWLDGKFPNEHELYFKILTLLAVFGSVYSFIRQVITLSNEEEKNESK